jgi:uncharacterized protein (DUF1501 family)
MELVKEAQIAHMFSKEAAGARLQATNGNIVQISSTAFVGINTHHNEGRCNKILHNTMQDDYNKWKQIIESSGGKLSEEKVTYFMIYYEFSTGIKPTTTNGYDSINAVKSSKY